jgi:hypothetical protein
MTRAFISDLKLEQFVLEELSSGEAPIVRDAIAQDDALRQRLALISKSDETFFDAHPVDSFTAEVQRRETAITDSGGTANTETQAPRRWPFVWTGLPVAAVALLAVFLVLPESVTNNGYRTKGIQPHLVAHRILGQKAELLIEGDATRVGDRIQLSVIGGEGNYLAVFSIDGNSTVTLHYPRETESGPWPGDNHSLPYSYELDDAPKFERFFLVAQKDPIDVDALLELARGLAQRSDAEEGWSEDAAISTFLIEKVE